MYRETNLQERLQYQVRNLESLGLSKRFVRVVHCFFGRWFGTWILFFHILGITRPTDERIFFRGVVQPPTSGAFDVRWNLLIFLVLWLRTLCSTTPLEIDHARELARRRFRCLLKPFDHERRQAFSALFTMPFAKNANADWSLKCLRAGDGWGRRRRDTLRQP